MSFIQKPIKSAARSYPRLAPTRWGTGFGRRRYRTDDSPLPRPFRARGASERTSVTESAKPREKATIGLHGGGTKEAALRATFRAQP